MLIVLHLKTLFKMPLLKKAQNNMLQCVGTLHSIVYLVTIIKSKAPALEVSSDLEELYTFVSRSKLQNGEGFFIIITV